MGKFKKNRRNRHDSRQGNQRTDSRVSYASVVKQNAKLEKYYNTILNMPEDERAEFWEALKRELPNSFRFCGSKGHALAVRDLLETRYFPKIESIEYEGKKVELPKPVPWYPDNLAWWMATPKNVIRKFPPFSAFQKFLVSETSVGHITRQEVVSMIPPLLLDVRSGMVVLDMCAAPGSKSSQLLEMLHAGEETRIKKVLRQYATKDGLDLGPETEEEVNVDLSVDPSDDGRATGLLIANDSDYKRCHMLTHQLKRLSSANVLITNHDATQYPSIKLSASTDTKKGVYLKFDRILTDVPCSGDGTLRKNMTLWGSWVPGSALGLHLTQVRILVRALQLLKVGGRVVYSTCSMNPIENESVISAAIDRCGGPEKVGIIDCSDKLPDLKRKPGLKHWSVMDKSGKIWNSWKELEDMLLKEDDDFIAPGKIVESMFPKPEGHPCADIPLERCMRVYAHLQDTGGFFITVLEKKADFKARPESSAKSSEAKPQERAPKAPAETAVGSSAGPIPEAAEAPPDQVNINGKRHKEEAENGIGDEEEPLAKKAKVAPGDTKADGDMVMADAMEATPNTDADPTEVPQAESVPKLAEPPKADERQPRRDTSIRYEEPYVFIAGDHPTIQDIKKAYRLSDRFPLDRFLVRNVTGAPTKAVYYTTTLARQILRMNDGKGVKFVHGGVKMFMRQDVPNPDICRWRIQSEGMPLIEGYVGEQRVVRLTKKATLRSLLIEMFPKIADGAWTNLGEIGERVRDMEMGCNVLRIEPDGDEDGFKERIVLPLWKSIHSLNLMLPKEDRSAMLLRLFNDMTPLVNNGLQMQKDRETRRQEAMKAEAEAEEQNGEDAPADETTQEVAEPGDANADASGQTADDLMAIPAHESGDLGHGEDDAEAQGA